MHSKGISYEMIRNSKQVKKIKINSFLSHKAHIHVNINNINCNDSYIFISPRITCGVSIETEQIYLWTHSSISPVNQLIPLQCTSRRPEIES
jgi:hypothetical protein